VTDIQDRKKIRLENKIKKKLLQPHNQSTSCGDPFFFSFRTLYPRCHPVPPVVVSRVYFSRKVFRCLGVLSVRPNPNFLLLPSWGLDGLVSCPPV
jgi:hypothetical protein